MEKEKICYKFYCLRYTA